MAAGSHDRISATIRNASLSLGPWTRNSVGIVDQLISSLTNVIAAVLAARALGAKELGTFAICASLVTIAIGLSRVTASDPLVLTQSTARRIEQRAALKSALACSMLISFGSGCIVAFLGIALGERGYLAFLPAMLLPLVGAQDCLRYFWIMSGDQGRALRSDLIWLLLLGLGQVLQLPKQTDASSVLVLWLGSGAVAGIAGMRLHIPVGVRSAVIWLHEQRSIVWPQLGQFAVGMGTGFLMVPLVALLASVSEAGEFRIAQILASPYSVVAQGINMVFLPHLVRANKVGVRALRRAAAQMSLLLVLCATGNLLLIALVPEHLVRYLLGENWTGSSAVSLLLAAQSIPVAIGAGATAAVLAARWMIASLKLKAVVSILTLLLSCSGALLGGAAGAAVGLMIAASIATPLWWWLLARHSNEDQCEGLATAQPDGGQEPTLETGA